MHCPACNYKDTRVTDSRLTRGGMSIRRRRACPKCHYRFSTIETTEILDLTVVKRNGSREAYRREKLTGGLHKALEKRPVTEDNFQGLVALIERDLQRRRTGEITSREIGEIIMHRLRSFDTVAYIRFASVYRQFKDAATFARELSSLKVKGTRPEARRTRRKSK